ILTKDKNMWLTNKKRYRITNLTSVSHVSGPRQWVLIRSDLCERMPDSRFRGNDKKNSAY
ncbi:MAG: hypothetical protein UR22_C0001G0134, partial [Parcubacteria group bacterium GW2011_GWC2_32_10]